LLLQKESMPHLYIYICMYIYIHIYSPYPTALGSLMRLPLYPYPPHTKSHTAG